MWALLKRELNGFFNSLIAYVVMAVFLIITSLFLWVFPAGYNIPDSGYANLDGLFVLTPFVFLFLIPAITMRLFSDELRTGTIEMLMTKPVSDLQVLLSKYLAGVALMVVSVLPTLIYLLTVHLYAAPPGVDMGGAWGSYLGLLLLGMVFVAVGLFASSLTENQVLAFIIALFLNGFLYMGFEMIHGLDLFGQMDLFVRKLGLNSHYTSISRGVVDSRDLIYFAGVIVLFLAFTRERTGRITGRRPAKMRFLSIVVLVIAANIMGQIGFTRWDLTSEKRYTLTDTTREMLRELDDIVYFRVYLDGDLPTEFRRLRNDTREMLDEFRAYSDLIQFEFVSPADEAGDDPEQLESLYRRLQEKGLEPAQLQMRAGEGTSQRVVFPGALVSYKGDEAAVQVFQDFMGASIDEAIRHSSVDLEYKLAATIRKLTAGEKKRVAFLEGHGELPPEETASFSEMLEDFYDVERVDTTADFGKLKDFSALISARPLEPFSEKEKYVLDQYLMHGGSMLWMVDPVFADMDSLRQAPQTLGMVRDINMDDFFFRYGARLNPVLLKDLNAAPLPVTTGYSGGRPQINLLPWHFFPIITPTQDHEIVQNLNVIRTGFVSSIDTVETPDVDKHVLLETSPYTRIMPVPVRISLDILQQPVDEPQYRDGPQPLAMLLEGRFSSLFRNRFAPDVEPADRFERRDTSSHASMIVVTDGRIAANQFSSDGQPLPTGYDRYSGESFANDDFLMNAVNYLTGDAGFIEARAKDIRLRRLDRTKIQDDLLAVQVVNTVLPVLLVFLFGTFRLLWRKRKYNR